MERPFDTIAGYRLDQLIYEGPHTLVFIGRKGDIDPPVLIKLLKPHELDQPTREQRFQREAKVSVRLQHANIVKVLDTGKEGRYLYIIMQYIAGASLRDILDRHAPLPPHLASEIITGVFRALAYAHDQGVVHRDVKPANVLVDGRGNVKLTDFGLARLDDASTEITQQGTILGSPAYMAPEQITGEAVGPPADLFAAGALWYELLSGRQAFGGESISVCLNKVLNEALPELPENVPPEVGRMIQLLVNKDVDERPTDAGEVVAAMMQFAPEPPSAGADASLADYMQRHFPPVAGAPPAAGKAVPASQQPGRYRRPLLLALVLTIVFLGLFGWWSAGQQPVPLPASGQQSSAMTLNDTTAARALPPDTLRKVTAIPTEVPQKFAADSPRSQNEPDGETAADAISTTREAAPAGILRLELVPWADVFLNDQRIDSHAVALTMPLDSGTYRLRFVHPNFPPHVARVEIRPGETHEINWSFMENTGYLWLEVRPWANVLINSRKVDTTPLKRPVALTAGVHTLLLRHPDYLDYRESITIFAGDTLTRRVMLNDNAAAPQ